MSNNHISISFKDVKYIYFRRMTADCLKMHGDELRIPNVRAKTVLVFYFLIKNNGLFLGQVRDRWTFFWVWFWPVGLFLGITTCLYSHIPVTINVHLSTSSSMIYFHPFWLNILFFHSLLTLSRYL